MSPTASTAITVLQRHREQVVEQIRSVQINDDPRPERDLTEQRRQQLVEYLEERKAVWDEAIAALEERFGAVNDNPET